MLTRPAAMRARIPRNLGEVGGRKNLTQLIREAVAQEVNRLRMRVLGTHGDPVVDQEATEMAMRSSMHRVGGVFSESLGVALRYGSFRRLGKRPGSGSRSSEQPSTFLIHVTPSLTA